MLPSEDGTESGGDPNDVNNEDDVLFDDLMLDIDTLDSSNLPHLPSIQNTNELETLKRKLKEYRDELLAAASNETNDDKKDALFDAMMKLKEKSLYNL